MRLFMTFDLLIMVLSGILIMIVTHLEARKECERWARNPINKIIITINNKAS